MHVLISHLGNDSLLHRVTNFQTTDVREHALEKADKLIEINDLTSIKQKSPAAGTFYVWVSILNNTANVWVGCCT
jgi:polysaccharide pyruvyl transferase WcaK-like protein